MASKSGILSEKIIITMIQENNPLVWTSLYDKHSPDMYGLVCNLTDDKFLSQHIFSNAFIQLKKQKTLTDIKFGLYAILLRHTYCYALTYLKQVGVNPKALDPS